MIASQWLENLKRELLLKVLKISGACQIVYSAMVVLKQDEVENRELCGFIGDHMCTLCSNLQDFNRVIKVCAL